MKNVFVTVEQQIVSDAPPIVIAVPEDATNEEIQALSGPTLSAILDLVDEWDSWDPNHCITDVIQEDSEDAEEWCEDRGIEGDVEPEITLKRNKAGKLIPASKKKHKV